MGSQSRRELHARIAIRDRLIRGIIGHLKRRGDSILTDLVERAAGLVWDNDNWLTDSDSRIGRDIRAFAQMDLSRGKQKHADTGPGTIRAASGPLGWSRATSGRPKRSATRTMIRALRSRAPGANAWAGQNRSTQRGFSRC